MEFDTYRYNSEDILDFLARKAGYDKLKWITVKGESILLLICYSEKDPMDWVFIENDYDTKRLAYDLYKNISKNDLLDDDSKSLNVILELSKLGKEIKSGTYVKYGNKEFKSGIVILPAYSTLEKILVEMDLALQSN